MKAIPQFKIIKEKFTDKGGKIKTIEELAGILEFYRVENKKIVLCHGVFDLLHIGHIRYFEQAARMGDVLIVTITPDQHVDKGPFRPAFNEMLRAEAIASLNCVDYVAVNEESTAEKALRILRPNFYVKGSEFKNTANDYTGKIAREKAVVEEIGAKMTFTEDIVYSSSNLINRHLSNLPKEINQYLELFRQRYCLQDVLNLLKQMSSLKVLVVGDTIIDDYQFCDAIGKSSKDPTLALKYKAHDLFAGGVLAVANHVANFSDSVQVATVIGDRDSYEEFIKGQLHPNISHKFFVQPNAPTIVKRRFIDGYSFNKLLEIYIMNDDGLPPAGNEMACQWIDKRLSEFDLVIAADFGHGAISEDMVQLVTDKAKFLAVNTQANAGNRGFHTISRYKRADFACIAEHEMRLEARIRNGNLRPEMIKVAQKLGCASFIVTRGRNGCAVCGENGEFVQVPSFAINVVDRVGAGDAFLSVTSLAAVLNAPNEILAFLGNVTGALAVENIGNKKAIDRLSIQKFITSLLK